MKIALLAALAIFLQAGSADARKPEDVFAGRIMLSTQSFPRTARSEEDFISKVKNQSKDRFDENKEDHEWHLYLAAFFQNPVRDLEVTIKIFDVTSGQRLVETFEQYVSADAARSYLSDVHLKRGDGTAGYDPNTKIHMQVESKGRIIAESTFYLIGEAKKYTGKVDFSDEEKK